MKPDDPDAPGQKASARGDDRLLSWRQHFPIVEHTNYLISNSLGAVPAAAAHDLQDYYETWATRGVRAWEETWWTMVADLGHRVAPLIGAKPGEVVFQPNITLAHAVVLSAFDFPPRRSRIDTDAMHFPSILYLIDEKRRDGALVTLVPCSDGVSVDTQRLIEAIDEETAFVSHRPGAGIRISPHFYTRDDELEAAIEAITEIQRTGAWRAFITGGSTVT
jgi:kynureninase